MTQLLSFLWLFAYPFLKVFALIVECTGGGEVHFNFILVDTTSVPRYRLERSFRASDQNCVGAINIIGISFDGDEGYDLIELGPKVFQKLPKVDTLNLQGNKFHSSNRDMYHGSPNIQTINFHRNYFPKLDADTQFPVEIRKLDFSVQKVFDELRLEFFTNHLSLTELDITDTQAAAAFTFEEGIFQTAISLEILIMKYMPVQKLKKSLLSHHAVTLKHVDMTKWDDLTSVEYNAFNSVSLEELNLSEWPFQTVDVDLFSGASIKKLNLQRSKIESLQPGSFAGLDNSQEIDLFGSKVRSIESGSFRDFFPLDNFKLTIPKDISCCNMEGLRELISASNGISINENLLNYTCVTPDNTEKVVNILSNEDPSLNLPCCNYQKEFYNSQLQSCERCKIQEFCTDMSDDCKGEETNFRTCNKCKDGFAVNSFECQACKKSSDCVEASAECSLSPGNEIYLKCNTCTAGFAPDPVSGMCGICLELSPSCISYDTSCIVGTNTLACKTCNDDAQLIEGSCVIVEDSSLPLGVIVGISIGIIVLIASVSVIVLLVALYRRRKRKERELRKACGIPKNESGVELYPVEFETKDPPLFSSYMDSQANEKASDITYEHSERCSWKVEDLTNYHNMHMDISKDSLKVEDLTNYHNMHMDISKDSLKVEDLIDYWDIDMNSQVNEKASDITVLSNSQNIHKDSSKAQDLANYDYWDIDMNSQVNEKASDITVLSNYQNIHKDSSKAQDLANYDNIGEAKPNVTSDTSILSNYHNLSDDREEGITNGGSLKAKKTRDCNFTLANYHNIGEPEPNVASDPSILSNYHNLSDDREEGVTNGGSLKAKESRDRDFALANHHTIGEPEQSVASDTCILSNYHNLSDGREE